MRVCEICGSTQNIERHHVFNGAYKKKSERYGALIDLCHSCHNEPPNGVHHNAENMQALKAKHQNRIMQEYQLTTEQFIHLFGKNYIGE